MKYRSVAALLALTLPLSAQNQAERDRLPQAARKAGAAAPGKRATPTGEAPGPWLLGTIGVGKTADPKVPQTTALKGLAIKVGEHGEAAVAYDLDLCRMAGAWTGGKFVTPMNLMSRGEYPTALGEVAFTTGEVPGFLCGEDAEPGKSAELQGKKPTPRPPGSALSSKSTPLPPPGSLPPQKSSPPPELGSAPPEQRNTPPEPGSAPPELGSTPPEQRSTPPERRSPPPEQRSAPPEQGRAAFGAGITQGTSVNGDLSWKDPRPEPFGPLPPGQPRFQGFYVNGNKTILKWDIGGTEVLEMPLAWRTFSTFRVARVFSIAPSKAEIWIAICEQAPGTDVLGGGGALTTARVEGNEMKMVQKFYWFDLPVVECATGMTQNGKPRMVCRIEERAGQIGFRVPPSDQPLRCGLVMEFAQPELPKPTEAPDLMKAIDVDLRKMTSGGPARWPETVTTAGEVSAKTDAAYVVDTIKLPDPNPWGAPMFVGGFDFFPDGRAAVCTFHGDVFVVSGITAPHASPSPSPSSSPANPRHQKKEGDGEGEGEGEQAAARPLTTTWKRFASGLYHALGLKIVQGEIYVTCRDGLWRLRDLNGDGECDYYERFNGDVKVTKSFHEFVFDLQTDPAGNFYFAKAGPVKNGGRGFDEIMAHHGALLRVSPDGATLDVVATGFRAPNGIGCGPDGQLTTGDNEGTWTPACKINWITPGGFYGVVPLAHRDPPPSDYNRPLCWLPKRVDNSGGGQVWVPNDDRWGPWRGQLLHLSYGTCSLFGVLKEPVPGATSDPRLTMQGGVTRFPVNFQSGIMRARFNPVDGQLYVAGLRGWQTTGVRNGAFQRVRFTGAPVRMPIALHATTRGVRLDFACALDPQSANDPQNWNVEVWNYLWSSAYGSPELSTLAAAEKPGDLGKDGEPQFTKAQSAQKKHDPLAVKSATLSTDGRSVFLELPEIKPVMQMAIRYGLQAADGAEVRGEVVNTIHALGEK